MERFTADFCWLVLGAGSVLGIIGWFGGWVVRSLILALSLLDLLGTDRWLVPSLTTFFGDISQNVH